MIVSMANNLKRKDYEMFREWMRTFGIGFVLDGHKMSNHGITLFRGRGYDKSGDLKQRYVKAKDIKKNIRDVDNLTDLLHIDTGKDIAVHWII